MNILNDKLNNNLSKIIQEYNITTITKEKQININKSVLNITHSLRFWFDYDLSMVQFLKIIKQDNDWTIRYRDKGNGLTYVW